MPTEKTFKCRVCGHDKYEGLREKTGHEVFGQSYRYTHYCCSNCSAMFKYPQKFSVGEEIEVTPEDDAVREEGALRALLGYEPPIIHDPANE